jgi:hypothetical protein
MSPSAIFFLLVAAPVLAVFLAILGLTTLQTNLLGWVLLIIGDIYAVSFILVPIIRMKPNRKKIRAVLEGTNVDKEEQGYLSFWMITVGMMSVFFFHP